MPEDVNLLSKTPLFSLHRKWGGRVVDFAGYALPLAYSGGGFIAEHVHTRKSASMFDVSHMAQVSVAGPDAAGQLSKLMPADVASMGVGVNKYTLLTNRRGGVIDDLIVSNDGERGFFMVFNASRRKKALSALCSGLSSDCVVTEHVDRALLAVQGPKAKDIVAGFCPEAIDMPFMRSAWFEIDGYECRLSRSGYTGEDGFEISIPDKFAVELAKRLVSHDMLQPAGLGARDSLRLEAGLCLYGNELTEDTTPIEAGLLWAIPRARRVNGGYTGADVIERQILEGAKRKLVGLRADGKTPARRGAQLSAGGQKVGEITSGIFSPSLGVPIAFGYVLADNASLGAHVSAEVRGKEIYYEVVKLPFTQHRYLQKKNPKK